MVDFFTILGRNFLQPIVLTILGLAIALLWLGEARDAYFLSSVILLNTIFSVIQEFRARMALKKLELMSAPTARKILPSGNIKEIPYDELKTGDTVQLLMGDEVPADGEIVKSDGLEVDESILTGESAPVLKPIHQNVYAASSVVAGGGSMLVSAVGAQSRAGIMTATLRRYKPNLTPLQKSINQAITWLTYGAVVLSLMIALIYRLKGYDAVAIFKTIASSSATIVPEGLLLASSLLLAFGSLKLAAANVLPQKLSAIEAMALIDILCVDKTGTLTDNHIQFEEVIGLADNKKDINDIVKILAIETSSGSSTGAAIIDGLPEVEDYIISGIVAFSSRRKYSGGKVHYHDKTWSVLMGAPEMLQHYAPLSDSQSQIMQKLTSEGKRVMLAVLFEGKQTDLNEPKPNSGLPLCFIVLSNNLRVGVKNTIKFLQGSGVKLKVISGDNPKTVQYIAKQAGIKYSDKVITGSELALINDQDWDKTIEGTTIFARILPEQKQRIVETYHKLGFYTGMVGDGINDALALKHADLGVAMRAGAAASRRVADLIVMDNSFNSLPLGMTLGNKVMQAIELIATLFFHKIIFAIVLLMLTLAMGVIYPFAPRHITFLNIFLVTIPTLIWTFFPLEPGRKIKSKNFWKETLFAISPIAVITGIALALIYRLMLMAYPDDAGEVRTLIVVITTIFGVNMVFLVPRLFSVIKYNKDWIVSLIYLAAVALVVVPSFSIKLVRNFFDFTLPVSVGNLPLLIAVIVTIVLQWQIAMFIKRRFANH